MKQIGMEFRRIGTGMELKINNNASKQIIYKYFPNERRFGIELELSNNITKKQLGFIINEYENIYNENKKNVVLTPGKEGWAQTKENDFWHVKFDRTCGPLGKNFDHGWEIASYIGKGIDDVNHISRLARFLDSAGAEVNQNCGFHIHVEVKDFDNILMGNLLSRWLKIENFLISICHVSRKDNPYCKPLRKKINKKTLEFFYKKNQPETLWELFRPMDLSTYNNYQKRVTLNTINFAISKINPKFSRNTIELRLPECRLQENYTKNWIRLILNFVENCKNNTEQLDDLKPSKSLKDILKYLGLSDDNNFVFLCPDLINTKVWILNSIIEKSQNKKLINEAKKYKNIFDTKI